MSPRSSTPKLPSYRHHKPSGQAVVTLNGRDCYLGKWDSKASKAEYERLIGEWFASGRHLPGDADQGGLSVAEMALRFLKFAERYYRKDGRPTSELDEFKQTIRPLRRFYGSTPARDFGPRALKTVRQAMIDSDLSRGVVNHRISRLRRIFKWAVAEELIPPSVFHGLSAVEGLRKGRTQVRESTPIKPVVDAVVDATLPRLSPIVVAMVQFQRLTGCRPAEVCALRPCDINSAGDVWIYQPESHKTEHHGQQRLICIGPKAQDILRPYLLRDKVAYCFVPVESEKKRQADQHSHRVTPLSCGNRPGTNRKRWPKRHPGNRYTTNTYRRAIHRAVDAVNRRRQKNHKDGNPGVELLPKWSPNQLRHTTATLIRKQFGLEAAQVALGHSQANVTQVYAERDMALAAEVMRKIG